MRLTVTTTLYKARVQTLESRLRRVQQSALLQVGEPAADEAQHQPRCEALRFDRARTTYQRIVHFEQVGQVDIVLRDRN